MALIPTIFRDWWEDLERPSRLFDQNFGLGLTRNELLNNLAPASSSLRHYYRPWRSLLENSGGTSRVSSDKDKFEVIIDVQQFAPDEITVKTVDKAIVVEAKHEEKKDEHGYISRQFVRRYLLPEGHDIDNVQSNLSSDGVLTVTAPSLRQPPTTPGEKVIPIQRSAAPAVKSP